MRSSKSLCFALALAGAALGTSCGRGPTAPSTPPVSISCPVAQSAQSLDGNPVIVTYPGPTASGGQGVLSTSCTPATGSRFNVGTTNVTCTTQDTRQQTASCGFQVTVTRVPRISATRFMAFGDSMTEGFLTTCPVTTLSEGWTVEDDLELLRTVRPPGFSAVAYPLKLQSMLSARYAAQSVIVINEGSGGETAVFGATQFPGVVSNDMPQAVLLLEGINDINQGGASAITPVISSLRSMVQDAKRRGMSVFLATLLPQRKGSCRDFDWRDGVEDVVPANAQIRTLASTEGVTLVDLYPAFAPALGTLIGPDGLHPSEAGYQKMADLFYAAITQRLEQ
ncbi:MAG TPA: GDSL-type esterase/lipase family protein [Vicinamibacterales bacterium]|nr:GDSL-type esterase/lipase family protein [Vicinamibacterales bacterium]